jgi:hypothetical protein
VPHMVVVPLSTLRNWERELATWAPQLNVVVLAGNEISRQVGFGWFPVWFGFVWFGLVSLGGFLPTVARRCARGRCPARLCLSPAAESVGGGQKRPGPDPAAAQTPRPQVTMDTEFYASPDQAITALDAVGGWRGGRGGPPVRGVRAALGPARLRAGGQGALPAVSGLPLCRPSTLPSPPSRLTASCSTCC